MSQPPLAESTVPPLTMRILIYKRTHRGDPDANGIFGIDDCMGSVRDFRYDAVIGVGGIGDDPKAQGIAGKITWVGIGPRKFDGGLINGGRRRGSLVVFKHFALYDTAGDYLRDVAPVLAERIYKDSVRLVIDSLSETERAEAVKIVRQVSLEPASPGFVRLSSGLRGACSAHLRDQTDRCSKRSPSASQGSNITCRP